jgi:hypothetical protein
VKKQTRILFALSILIVGAIACFMILENMDGTNKAVHQVELK